MKKQLTLVLLLLLWPAVARADNPEADALYKEGKKLVAEGKIREGCLKLAASDKAEPALGTLLALAACHEKENKTATAWRAYQEAEQRGGDPGRIAYARERWQALEPNLVRIVLDVKCQACPPLTIDVGPYRGVENQGVPVDPADDLDIRVVAEGKKPWRKLVVARSEPGEMHVQVVLEDQIERRALVVAPPTEPAPRSRAIPIAVTIVGAAALVAGGVLVGVASGKGDDAVSQADTANRARDAAGYAAANASRDDALLLQGAGFGTMILGAVMVGIGSYLTLRF